MILGIDNGWRGPIAGVASMAALAITGQDGLAELALERKAILSTPRIGQRFSANDATWEVMSRVDSPRHLLIFHCSKIEPGV